jgi:hypothetical protein
MNRNLISRLETRKQAIVTTIAHIRQQQAEVERNAVWMDVHTRQRRRAFLAELLIWYDDKLKQINRVIERMTQPDSFAWSEREPGTVAPDGHRSKEVRLAPRK